MNSKCVYERQALKETYKCKHCDFLFSNSETFDETHARDVPTTLQMMAGRLNVPTLQMIPLKNIEICDKIQQRLEPLI